MLPNEPVKIAMHVLDKQRVAMAAVLPAGIVRDSVMLDTVAEYTMDMLMVRLSAFVLTEQLVNERHTVESAVPKTWWQHFKRDKMPAWFGRKFPVLYEVFKKTVIFNAKGVYPNANIALPSDRFGDRILFETVEETPWGTA